MPANLTHKYIAAEKAYRNASSPQEELECLLEMLREIPKHKGTDKLQAELKKKISQAKEVAANPQTELTAIVANSSARGRPSGDSGRREFR